MPVINVFSNIFGDYPLMFFKGIQIISAHLGGDFIADMQKLAKIGIVLFARLVMPQCLAFSRLSSPAIAPCPDD